MNKWFFYVFFPISVAVITLGIGLTFGYLPNFIEYKKFEKLYNIENGNNDSNSMNINKFNVIFANDNINNTLNKYNNSQNKKEFINNKLSLVFNSTTINFDTLNSQIEQLKQITNEQISVWDQYKNKNVISEKFSWNIFQTINYFSVLNSITFISTNYVGFGVGLAFLPIGLIGFGGLLFFYYSSRKYGISSDLEYDGIITHEEKEEFDNYSPSEKTFDKEDAIYKISESKEMKNFLENNETLGFKNQILQRKSNVDYKNNFDKSNSSMNTKKIILDVIKKNQFKNKTDKKNVKKLSKKDIDKVLQGK